MEQLEAPPERLVLLARTWLVVNKVPTAGKCLSLAKLLWIVEKKGRECF